MEKVRILLVLIAKVYQYFVVIKINIRILLLWIAKYEGWNFNSGNYLFTTDTK